MSAACKQHFSLVFVILTALLIQGCSAAKDEKKAPPPGAGTAELSSEEPKGIALPPTEPAATDTIPTDSQPAAAAPATMPEAIDGKVSKVKPQAARPKAAMPKAAAPKVAVPKAVEPLAVEPKMVEPIAAEPKTVAEAKPGYELVKVFYATDRAAVEADPWTRLGAISWGYLSLTAAAIAIVFLILRWIKKSRKMAAGFYIFLLAAVALSICSFVIPRTTKPRDTQLARNYTNDRGELEVGTCEVSIPAIHQIGELERPSLFLFEFNEDPTKHVMVMSVEQEEPQKFFSEVKQQVDKSAERQTFVFVHGYNVTFEGAAQRTAQLKYDLEFDGPAIFYSWPSQGALMGYMFDENNVAWTVPHLEEFLKAVAEKTGAKQIHLIAHSMGNRALTAALERLSNKLLPDEAPLFNEVLLTAPDIDADIFRRDIAPSIVKTARRVTLYASSNDDALKISKKFHGYPRAGESGDNLVIVSGIDTIDVSGVDTSLLGHTYYGDNDTVITDIVQLLRESKPPGLRARLRAAIRDGLEYWVFKSDDVREP